MCWCCGGRSVTRVRSLSRSSKEGRNFAQPQTRGDCSTALKFESSETVHQSAFCRSVPGEPSGTSLPGENAWRAIKGRARCFECIHELTVRAVFASSSTDSPKTKPASARMKFGSSFNPGINSNRRMPWWAASSRASMLISLRVST